jgi:hypothetical protein
LKPDFDDGPSACAWLPLANTAAARVNPFFLAHAAIA